QCSGFRLPDGALGSWTPPTPVSLTSDSSSRAHESKAGLIHACRVAFYASALVETMLSDSEPDLGAPENLLLRVGDLVIEAEFLSRELVMRQSEPLLGF